MSLSFNESALMALATLCITAIIAYYTITKAVFFLHLTIILLFAGFIILFFQSLRGRKEKKSEEFSSERTSDKFNRDDVKKLENWTKNRLKDWKNIVIVLLGALIVFCLVTYALPYDIKERIQIMAAYLSISAVLLGIAVPTVSLDIFSGRTINEAKKSEGNPYKGILEGIREPTAEEEKELYEVIVDMKNASRFPGRFYLNFVIEVDGEVIEREQEAPLYHNKESWSLHSNKGVRGWFSIDWYVKEAGTNMTDLKSKEEEKHSILKMNAKVRNAGFFGHFIHYPKTELYFDFDSYKWYNKKYGYEI